jgi:hypothetical protein
MFFDVGCLNSFTVLVFFYKVYILPFFLDMDFFID